MLITSLMTVTALARLSRNKPGAFEAVLDSARRLVFVGCKVSFFPRVRNKNEVEDVLRLARESDVSQVKFGGIIATPWNQEMVLSDGEELEIYQHINALQVEAGLKIKIASSLYAGGGIRACNVMNMENQYFKTREKMIFCCDIFVDGIDLVIGSLEDESLVDLVSRWLSMAAGLQSERAHCIARGEMGEGFDSCVFCIQYLGTRRSAP